MSERRKRLHELLLTLINKDVDFELIEDDTNPINSRFSDKGTVELSRSLEKNRKIIKKYQSLIKSAVTLDALMDSENDENYKIK